MLVGQPAFTVIAIVTFVALELWRRSLGRRAPSWLHAAAMVLLALGIAAVAYATYRGARVFTDAADVEPANKATTLARNISAVMQGDALAILCGVLAIIVLAVSAIRARRLPRADDPSARLR